MRKVFVTSVVAIAVAAGLAAAPALRAGDLTVTASYTGKGAVDETHEIWVFLFDSPQVTAASKPITSMTIKKSGGSATFKNVAQDTVYVLLAYDVKGDYDGTAGPPPPGTPIGSYSTDGKAPSPVKPAAGAKVKATFDDSRRMGGQ
jgi:hypothetical protein